ncbi:MAG: VanW family protein [Clostridiales bacterium]|jgi:vancomycin resistance protein YoaR|nr:VanW family protein [Eubacteriales bacterium]MDH7567106.1 VanW family protein [Clostridiales bacterium]
MDTQVQKASFKFTRKNAAILSVITLLLLVIALSAQAIYSVLKYDRIYKGVYIGDINVSGLSVGELKALLTDKYGQDTQDNEIILKKGNISDKILYRDLNVTYDVDGAVEKAYSVGRSGNVFKRIQEILSSSLSSAKLDIGVSFDREKAENIINSLYQKTLVNLKEADLILQADKVIIRSGHHGESIDKSRAFEEMAGLIRQCKSGVVDVPVIETQPSPINADELLKKINVEAVDASVKVENNKVTIVPHVVGRHVDKAALDGVVAELGKSEDAERSLPIAITEPKIKTEDVYAKLFKDTLSSFSTQFHTSTQYEINRAKNIRLAVAKINGKILAPGQVFSFNDTVGPRTVDGGYEEAYVYVDGKVVPGIGGGICQVSSTLYGAVLFSDLEVNERANHMFTVSYVPLGRDAAVAYGQVDFKFKNSTSWPIKLEGWVSQDNKIFFAIKGTNETPGKTVEITHKTVKEINFATKYIDDPSLEEGKTEIKQKGGKGYVVDTYKTVKVNGKVVSQQKIHTSTYRPLDQEIKRGTKKVNKAPAAGSQPPAQQQPSTTPAPAAEPPAEQPATAPSLTPGPSTTQPSAAEPSTTQPAATQSPGTGNTGGQPAAPAQ